MSLFDSFDLYNILFLDIETVPGVYDFEELSEEMQELWAVKARSILRKTEEELEFDELVETYRQRAGIYAEFGKIICISVGFLTRQPGNPEPLLRLKSFSNHLEASVLEDFSELLGKHFNNPDKFALCGHNIKEFDIPYICRRILVNQLPFPRVLDIAGRKPWEMKHLLDTMELWKFGDVKNYTSLRLLAAVFGFPSPKDDMDGKDVCRVYWQEQNLERIVEYCQKDVVTVARLFLRFKGEKQLLNDSEVVLVK